MPCSEFMADFRLADRCPGAPLLRSAALVGYTASSFRRAMCRLVNAAKVNNRCAFFMRPR